MPTATTFSTGSKPRAKATSKRASTARKTASAKRASARANTKRTTTSAESKAAHTRVPRAQTATRETAGVLGDYAERAFLIPVGAALIARDRVVESVSDTLSTYGSTSKTQAQLRRFERRGATARNRLEREVRKARVRVERELRQRRRRIEKSVNELEDRREAFAKSGSDLAGRVPELAKEVQERILSLV